MELTVFWLIVIIFSILVIWLAFYASKYRVPSIPPVGNFSYPLDHRTVVESSNDLLRLEELGIVPFKGLIVFCLEHNKVYVLEELDYHHLDSWKTLN